MRKTQYLHDKLLTWPEVREVVQLCRGTVRKLEKLGTFPPRQNVTDYSVRWRASDVAAYVAGKRDWAPERKSA